MTVCPKCHSTTVFVFRIDKDWAAGAGDYHAVNERTEYTEREWNMDAFDGPDSELYHCRSCGHMW